MIPESELNFGFSRSGGKGGQHVNKTETKVTLRWNFLTSQVLSDEEKSRLHQALAGTNRINDRGEIIIHASRTRSQDTNRKEAIERLHRLVEKAILPPLERIATEIPRQEKEKRLKAKRHQARKKQNRQFNWQTEL